MKNAAICELVRLCGYAVLHKPVGKTITERQAAQGLISNVLIVERALEKCVLSSVPQKVYDAVVSFAFNVGTGNACSSSLVKLLNQKCWVDACR
ncbi:hypothetical protein ENROMA047B_06780 [Enterobacter rongchengensis]